MKEKNATRGSEVRGQPGEDRIVAVDWVGFHRRLEAARTALDRKLSPSIQEQETILRARAEALACKPELKEGGAQFLEVVEFLLAQEQYGIELRYVREICPLGDLTALPCTPAFVLGLINVRGQILSVIDLKKFFDLPERGLTDRDKVLIVRTEKMELAILADAILGVHSIPLLDIQPSLPTLTGLRAEYLRGVVEGPIAVLNVKKILSDRRIMVDEDVSKAT